MKLSEAIYNIWILGMAFDCALFGIVVIKTIFVI
jgi:hypothetical protein